METMFIWIVLFSGAAVLLLGVFLVASERELKKKRGEIDDLVSRLEDTASASLSAPSVDNAANGAELADLRARNQELQRERAALQDDLQAAHLAIDDLRAERPAIDDRADLAEMQELRSATTQLHSEIDDLRLQLQASEAKLNSASASGSGANERQTQLENSLIDLKQQLEKSQARTRELENSAAPAVDLSAVESRHREETDTLQGRIAELQSRLSASAELSQQIMILEQRASESIKLEQDLRATLRRREEELSQWQERLAVSDEIKNRLVALQPVFDQLVAKQDSLIERQREYRGELESFAQFLSASHDGTLASPRPFDLSKTQTDRNETTPSQLILTPMAASNGDDATRAPDTQSTHQVNGDAEIAPQAKRGFGVFHALIALAVSGALAALFWSQRGDEPVIHAAKPSPIAAPAKQATPEPLPEKATPSNAPAADTALSLNSNADAPVDPKTSVRQAKSRPAPSAVTGTYEVTRGTRVFAAPNEFARQVGEIEPGLKVNVVDAREGWLEIRSKHGRPPGFIRSDTAARAGG